LEINESILTGESEPVEKNLTIEGLEKDIPLTERKNMVFQGTYIHIGNAKAVVVKTGERTEMGAINEGLSKGANKEIQLVKKINNIGIWLTFGMLILLFTSVIVRLNEVYSRNQLHDPVVVSKYLTDSIISTISIIPINIPILTTIILITGVYSMAQRKVVIRNLSSIESLGRISVLCSDKTGTITKGQMTASVIHDGSTSYNVLRKGHETSVAIIPESEAFLEKNVIDVINIPFSLIPQNKNLEFILINSLLNNEAQILIEDYIEPKESSWKSTGNPTDAALLSLSKNSGIDEKKVREEFMPNKSFPFDSRLKLMSKIYKNNNFEKLICFTKGAPEVVLNSIWMH
jgi:magnesium-transporting ATPase (P-type)